MRPKLQFGMIVPSLDYSLFSLQCNLNRQSIIVAEIFGNTLLPSSGLQAPLAVGVLSGYVQNDI